MIVMNYLKKEIVMGNIKLLEGKYITKVKR